ncbi:uncharacterized protein LOC113294005 [Papaver somniferum]|uniref:uncharacterized protein LOC113294005 n=1 Tax=Papaver somniferum TaxID=3469 RepID=UPI000E6FFF8A|nr:uncharacterized protein LOC113294005 [Papaver somniferum]
MHLNHLNFDDDESGKLSFVYLNYDQGLKFNYAKYDETLVSRKTRMNLNPPFEVGSCAGSINGLICRKTRMNLNPPFEIGSCAGSINGLICLDSSYTGISDNGILPKSNYGPSFICNPITREYIILPTCKGIYLWNGFGYSSSTNEYKVIRICSNPRDPHFGIAPVYILGSDSVWRNVGKMHMDKKYERRHGAFANGAFHWLNHHEKTIYAFHLADEYFSDFPSPPCVARPGFSYFPDRIGVLDDCLSAYSSSRNCEIWLLKKNKDNNDYSVGVQIHLRANLV